MINVDISKIYSNIKKMSKYKASFEKNYGNYYQKTENSSDYWVGKYATRFYDFQLSNRIINRKLINNVALFLELVSLTYDRYSKIISKSIKIEPDYETPIEKQYELISSSVSNAIDYLDDLENINADGEISDLGWCNEELDKSKEKTIKMFKDVFENEKKIKSKAASLDIKRIIPLEIDDYMVK